MARRQLAILGTEPERNDDLEDKARIYRGHMLDRMKFGKMESEAKAMLDAEIELQIKDKRIKLPADASKGKIVTIYAYDDDQGDEVERMEVKYGRKTQVRVRKAKAEGASDDDAEDLIEDDQE